MSLRFKSGETPELRAAMEALFAADPDLRRARQVAGALPDRSRAPGLKSLMMLIVEQQVSVASARAIWARVEAGTKPFSARRYLDHDEEALRGFGLSRPKMVYTRALAQAVTDGDLPLRRLKSMTDAEAMAALTAVKGIGRWTAEVYLLFALQRPDIFPAGDLALQAAAQDLKGLPARPDENQLAAMAEAWRPHRGVAARLLWRYYGVTRRRADPVSV
ncbi:DNA-3-methyladenine glycosylase family protein [Minwuia thermotolerans]|uniref:DNA-3-methyladenine glycosylase II n=1 Tax=Minwuia thermotolerans TaxID=2056226 RepID=A0A2M9G614_9PROT|nr:DNA-3-methyladenine glycosylase [Minwuia thermotolerans]PJK31157.1 DNA-3-methyladenine glycosylase 2 family protein [Minwuia thermotolerans]